MRAAGRPANGGALYPPAVAEMIGSYRETVTKAIGDFREAGMIQVEDELIYLTDITRLRALVGIVT